MFQINTCHRLCFQKLFWKSSLYDVTKGGYDSPRLVRANAARFPFLPLRSALQPPCFYPLTNMYEARQSVGFSREPRSRVIASDCKKKKRGQNGLFFYAPKQVLENQDDETHLNCLACCCCLCALLVSELKLCPDFSSSCHLVSCFCLVWGFLTHHSSSKKKKNSNTHTTESLTFFSY